MALGPGSMPSGMKGPLDHDAQSTMPSATDANAPINPRALDALRHMGGRARAALVDRIIGIFLNDTPPWFAQMGAAAQDDDSEALRRGAHRLKSSSANVGAERLAALFNELEMLGRSGSVAGAQRLLETAGEELGRVVAALQRQLAGRP